MNSSFKQIAGIVRNMSWGMSQQDIEEVANDVLWDLQRQHTDNEKYRVTQIRRSAKRRIIDHKRKHGHQKEMEPAWNPEQIVVKFGQAVKEAENEHLRDQLEDATAALPPKQREVVDMVLMQDRSIKDAAAEMGLTENVVSQRLFNAKQSLRAGALRDFAAAEEPAKATSDWQGIDCRTGRQAETYTATQEYPSVLDGVRSTDHAQWGRGNRPETPEERTHRAVEFVVNRGAWARPRQEVRAAAQEAAPAASDMGYLELVKTLDSELAEYRVGPHGRPTHYVQWILPETQLAPTI